MAQVQRQANDAARAFAQPPSLTPQRTMLSVFDLDRTLTILPTYTPFLFFAARSRARRRALQAMYAWQVSGSSMPAVIRQFEHEQEMEVADIEYFHDLLTGVEKHLAELDAKLRPYLDREVEEVDPIERAVLRLAAYELVHRVDVPYRVVINEAIEVAIDMSAHDLRHRLGFSPWRVVGNHGAEDEATGAAAHLVQALDDARGAKGPLFQTALLREADSLAGKDGEGAYLEWRRRSDSHALRPEIAEGTDYQEGVQREQEEEADGGERRRDGREFQHALGCHLVPVHVRGGGETDPEIAKIAVRPEPGTLREIGRAHV